jgi:hypothetical protein
MDGAINAKEDRCDEQQYSTRMYVLGRQQISDARDKEHSDCERTQGRIATLAARNNSGKCNHKPNDRRQMPNGANQPASVVWFGWKWR